MEVNKIIQGDCLEVMRNMEDNFIDACVTDPPYGLISSKSGFERGGGKVSPYTRTAKGGFMGKKWDGTGIEYNVQMWKECLRVLKPGGYLLSFGGTRTYHKMVVAIEDAGFEIRDMIAWVYSSGFPKSLNVFKQLKKQCTCGNMEAYERAEQSTKHNLRSVQQPDLPQEVANRQATGEVLQSGLSEQSISLQQSKSTEDVWQGQSSLEGRDNAETNSRELSGNDLSKMSEGVSTDGEERRIHNATQASDGSTPEPPIGEGGSGSSQRPQSDKQQDREPCAFCKQYGTQALGTLGIGTALKPALEPICVARKPFKGNVANNVLKWGTGGINIDGCRIEIDEDLPNYTVGKHQGNGFGLNPYFSRENQIERAKKGENPRYEPLGRFPANLIHDGSDELVRLFPNSKSEGGIKPVGGNYKLTQNRTQQPYFNYKDNGSASRFFYSAKASKAERNKGLEGFEKGNIHATVKPITLMRYLVKLVTPPQGLVLDPFIGSGTTGIACKLEGFNFIGIELEEDYAKIAEARIEAYKYQQVLI